MELTIPKEARGILAKFLQLAPDAAEKFVAAIKETEPRLDVVVFSARVASRCGLEESIVQDFVSMLIGMYLARVQAGKSSDAFN